MRLPSLLLITLLFCRGVHAQSHVALTSFSSDRYDILSLNTSVFLPNYPGHDITSTFPYTVYSDVTGTRSQENFKGGVKGKFSNPVYMLGLSAEIIRKHLGVDFGGGYYKAQGGDQGFYLQAGYRYVIPLGGLFLQPGVDLFYVRGVNKMGSIDNRQKELYFLGYTAHDQFTVTEDDGSGDGGTVKNTYDAERLDVKYQRYSILAQPKMTLTTQFKEKLFVSLELGYMLQLYQHCVMTFEQVNGSAHNNYTVGHITQGNNGMLNGVSATISVGWSL